MATQPTRYLFSTTEYHKMGKAGVFVPESCLELVEGEILEMQPLGRRHASAVLPAPNLQNRDGVTNTNLDGISICSELLTPRNLV